MKFLTDLIGFGIGLFLSLFLTPAVRRLAPKLGFVDQPGPRKVHRRPTPLLGGLAIYAAFCAAVLISKHGVLSHAHWGIFAGATLLWIVGSLDDRKLLHHQVKLFGAMPLAGAILIASGTRLRILSTALPGKLGIALDIGLTLFWIVGITAAFSILDHLDGLCAGIALISAAFCGATAVLAGGSATASISFCLVGATLGFLPWNFHPASIFMGDGGAMLLGFVTSALGIELVERAGAARMGVSWITPILILGVPIFDTTLVSISRLRRGVLPFATPGKDHTAHRLAILGLGHRGAVLSMYAFAAALGALGTLVSHIPPAFAAACMVIVATCAACAIWLLESAPYEVQGLRPASNALPDSSAEPQT